MVMDWRTAGRTLLLAVAALAAGGVDLAPGLLRERRHSYGVCVAAMGQPDRSACRIRG